MILCRRSSPVLTAGLLVAIARAGYPLRAGGNFLFEQTRYLLPLIGLYAFALGLAFSLLRGRALAAVTSVVVGVSSVHLLAAFVLTVRPLLPVTAPALGAAVAAAAIVIALVAIAAVRFLGEENPRRSGTNSIFPSEVVAELAPGQELCQAARVPAGTRAIEMPLRDGVPGDGLRLRVLAAGGRRSGAASARGPCARASVRFELPAHAAATTRSARSACARARAASAAFLGSLEQTGLRLDGGKPRRAASR